MQYFDIYNVNKESDGELIDTPDNLTFSHMHFGMFLIKEKQSPKITTLKLPTFKI